MRFAAAFLLLPAACSRPPDETLQAARAAVASRDWPALFALCDPDQRHALVWSDVLNGSLACMRDPVFRPEFDRIRARYRIPDPAEQPVDADPRDLLKDVPDLPALFTELTTFILRFKPLRSSFAALDGSLVQVRVSGNTAQAVYLLAEDRRVTITLVRRSGSWYLR